MTSFVGTSGDDNFTGTALSDTFDLTQGGDDIAKGGNYYDYFYLGGALTAADRIDGGAGGDSLYLDGDYSGGLVLGAKTVTNIEYWYLTAGHSYDITVNDGTNQNPSGVSIYAGNLGASDILTFDASAETSNYYSVTGGAGDDVVTTGGGSDYAYLQNGGNDIVNTGDGNDFFYGYGAITPADRLDGGDSYDTLALSGDYSGGLTFHPNTIHDIEEIDLWSSGNSYKLVFDDANIGAGGFIKVYGAWLLSSEKMTINGSAETDGSFLISGGAASDKLIGGGGDDTLDGGAGRDTLSGGAGDDLLQGGPGLDTLKGGTGADFFAFSDGDSTVAHPDLILDLTNADVINVSNIDADTTQIYDQAFVLVGHFHNTPGELVRSYDSGADLTSFLMDTDGDGVADNIIQASGDHSGFDAFLL